MNLAEKFRAELDEDRKQAVGFELAKARDEVAWHIEHLGPHARAYITDLSTRANKDDAAFVEAIIIARDIAQQLGSNSASWTAIEVVMMDVLCPREQADVYYGEEE